MLGPEHNKQQGMLKMKRVIFWPRAREKELGTCTFPVFFRNEVIMSLPIWFPLVCDLINSSKASLTQNNLARKSISLSHVSILES